VPGQVKVVFDTLVSIPYTSIYNLLIGGIQQLAEVKIITLGCAKNLVDSEVMTGMLRDAGFTIVDNEEQAELLLINTCGFIADAKKESVRTILEAVRSKAEGHFRGIIVTGCLAQRYKDELLAEIPEIDGMIGTGELPRIAEVAREVAGGGKKTLFGGPSFLYDHKMPRVLLTPKYYSYLKIAEGCDNRCAYCAIPEIRGGYRSRPVESIITETANLAAGGVREINLIAQDTTRYGLDLYGEFALDKLLARLNETEGPSWIRVLYAYPTHFTDRLIEVIAAGEKICKYLDIPLQHADDHILKSMNRQGTMADITGLVEKLRLSIPELAVRTTFIVGFPGETAERFKVLEDFIKHMEFDKVGVFTYSPEEGTPAAGMPGQVPDEIKEERKDRLIEIQQDISLKKNRKKIGSTVFALIEGKSEDKEEIYVGRTQTDAPEVDGSIFVKGKRLKPGDIVLVQVTHAYEYDLIGEVRQ